MKFRCLMMWMMMMMPILPALSLQAQPLWQVGLDNQSQDEFKGRRVDRYDIPTDWAKRVADQSDWEDMAKLSFDLRRPTMNFNYSFKQLPEHGVELSFRVLTSTKVVPQLAIYSNGTFAGLIQTWGPRGTATERILNFARVYRLYIPTQMLKAGDNELRIQLIEQPYGGQDGMDYLMLDYLKLDALKSPATEPIHGSVFYMGTNLTQKADGIGAFTIDQNTVRVAQPLLEWLGIAYSGNMMRVPYWTDVHRVQSHQRELLEKYRDLNMNVLADWLHISSYKPDADGNLPETGKAKTRELFDKLGDLFQYVEIANEPGLIGQIPKESVMAYAKYLKEIRPQHIAIVSPGWAFNNWAADVENRKPFDELSDYLGGHAYGLSYREDKGGSFVENLKSCGSVSDGYTKPFIASECGTNDWHFDWDAGKEKSRQLQAAAFDRVMRAHVAVAYAALQHAAFFAHAKKKFEKFSLFADVEDWNTFDPMTAEAWPGVEGQESRLQTFRRLACAYATHGTPLKWQHVDSNAMQYRKVLVRCVDTSTLAPLAGSHATSDKVLLNIVNFEDQPVTVNVVVTMPSAGTWEGKLIGPGDKLADAMKKVSMQASPEVTMRVELQARQTAQYILSPPTH